MIKKINNDIREYIENNTLRLEASHRGGGIEIDAEEYVGIEGAKMTAYQNYLGGGMLGSVQSSRNFETKTVAQNNKATELATALKIYFHDITNEDQDEWSGSSFESNQHRPASAY